MSASGTRPPAFVPPAGDGNPKKNRSKELHASRVRRQTCSGCTPCVRLSPALRDVAGCAHACRHPLHTYFCPHFPTPTAPIRQSLMLTCFVRVVCIGRMKHLLLGYSLHLTLIVGQCQCEPGFSSVDCSTGCHVACVHGTCDGGACRCLPGWGGDDYSARTCPSDCSPPPAECDQVDATCRCRPCYTAHRRHPVQA